MSIDDCHIKFYTNASNYAPDQMHLQWAKEAAESWAPTGVKIEVEYDPVIEREGYIPADDTGAPDLRNDGLLVDKLCYDFGWKDRITGKTIVRCSPSGTIIGEKVKSGWRRITQKLRNKIYDLIN